MSSGFADYASVYPAVDKRITAAALTVILVVNPLGIKTTQRVVQFLVIAAAGGLVVLRFRCAARAKPHPVVGSGSRHHIKGQHVSLLCVQAV